jgi:hypothetical protein
MQQFLFILAVWLSLKLRAVIFMCLYEHSGSVIFVVMIMSRSLQETFVLERIVTMCVCKGKDIPVTGH